MSNNRQNRRQVSGRGASENPVNRFQEIHHVHDPEETDLRKEELPDPDTIFLKDTSRSIITENQSPDVGFDCSINPYRGCEHGCIYCYARPTHEHLGFSSGLDFESRILVKTEAPALLREELSQPAWTPKTIAISGVTDAYQPVERQLTLTRDCLKILAEYRNPAAIITKNHLVTRDLDLFETLADYQAIRVYISVTTLDHELCGAMEPRTSRPHKRMEAIEQLASHGVPVGVSIAPVIPGLTDEEIPNILEEARNAGASFAGYVMLRLPHQLPQLFKNWLEDHVPGKKEKVLDRITSIREGSLNDTQFHERMKGSGPYAEQIESMFYTFCKQYGYRSEQPSLNTSSFIPPDESGIQRSLFW